MYNRTPIATFVKHISKHIDTHTNIEKAEIISIVIYLEKLLQNAQS